MQLQPRSVANTHAKFRPFTTSAEYFEMIAEDRHGNPEAFLYANAQVFRAIDFNGKRVLEVGSGRGLIAALVGLQGAARVVSMEPELAGATSGVIADQRRRMERLGLTNVVVEVADFNTWESHGQTFDVIISRASLNHLYPADRNALKHRDTYEGYLTVARRLHALLTPGGVFVATDASRYALFSFLRDLGIRRPWRWKRSGVNWRHHQNVGAWTRIFRDAGFSSTDVHYPVPYRLRALAPVVDSAMVNALLKGSFILHARR